MTSTSRQHDDEVVIDEYYVRKYMENNYGLEFLMKAGGLYGVGSNGRLARFVAWIYLTTWISLFPPLLITFYKVYDAGELEIACEAVHFAIFMLSELAFLISFSTYTELLGELFTLMGKGFHDYQNTLDAEMLALFDNMLDQSKRKKIIISKLFIGIVMSACVSITILRPFWKLLIGEHLLGTPDDGLQRLLPVTLWTPFNKESWYGFAIFLLLEEIISYVTPGIVIGCTLTLVCTCEDVGAQLTILGHTLKSVVQRAEGLDMPREQAIMSCFSHSIRHHNNLLACIKFLEKLLYIPGLGLLGGSTIMMCMSGFIFVSKEVPFASKLVFGTFLLSELLMIFLFCWCGENIQKTSTEIFDMVYSSEWTDNMKSMKNYVLLIQLRTIRPIKMTFGGLLDASLETFSNICSSAFSYFNLLLAMN